MKAIGYSSPGGIDVLQDIEIPVPTPKKRDLLVEVKAISVNPVDTKVRARTGPDEGSEYKVLGYDAAGVVVAVGDHVSLFEPGDEVYYAGDISRPGTNAQFHCVDERIAAKKPKSLTMAEAAAMPLTTITAWELLFDRWSAPLRNSYAQDCIATMLVVAGAGGVGSMLIQLARHLTAIGVVATASRPESVEWCKELGAHYVVSHREMIKEQMGTILIPQVEYIALLAGTDEQYPAIVEMLAPQGKIGIIDDPKSVLDFRPLKRKSASMHWEFMFARPLFETEDMIKQHDLLKEVARLVDLETLKTTMTENLGTINAENLRKAHAKQESGTSIGKTVLEGW